MRSLESQAVTFWLEEGRAGAEVTLWMKNQQVFCLRTPSPRAPVPRLFRRELGLWCHFDALQPGTRRHDPALTFIPPAQVLPEGATQTRSTSRVGMKA